MKKTTTQPSRPWWQVPLLFLVCLLGGSSGAWADARHFNDTEDHVVINGTMSLDNPYMSFQVMYHDKTSSHNAFFKSKAKSGKEDPALYIDDVFVCNPNQLSKYDDGKYGYGDQAVDDAENCNTWFGDQYTKTINGVKYTVMFYDPREKGGSSKVRLMTCVIFADKVRVGDTHSVRIEGWWHINPSTTNFESFTWNFKTISTFGYSKPAATMYGFDKMKVSGSLNNKYGPTIIGTYKNADGKTYTDNLTSSVTIEAKASEYKDKELACEGRPNYTDNFTKYLEYILKYDKFTPTGYLAIDEGQRPNISFYEWYSVNVPGYIYPTSVTVETNNLWKKEVKVKWTYAGSSTSGSWSIYRYPKNNASVRECIKNNITSSNTTIEQVVTAPTYADPDNPDNDSYYYEVAFIPNGATESVSALTKAAPYALVRSWSFTKFDATINDTGNKIELAWTHNAIGDASSTHSYPLVIQRSLDQKNWTDLDAKISVTSTSTVSGTYADANGLQPNTTYYYRLKVNLLEADVYSDIISIKLGGSKITDFTATRGSYNNMVKLQWSVNQVGDKVTNFIVQRRPFGSKDERAWADIYKTSGTASGYSYDDVTALPGSFNQYKVIILAQDGQIDDAKTADGFTIASGIVSGNIAFGTGTAVEGAKVVLKQQTADGEIVNGLRSLKFSGVGSGLICETDTGTIHSIFGGDFSIQMYLNPSSAEMNTNGRTYYLVDVFALFSLCLKYDAANKRYQVGAWYKDYTYSDLYIPADQWTHLTFVHDKQSKTTTVYAIGEGEEKPQMEQFLAGKTLSWNNTSKQADAIGIMQYYPYSANSAKPEQCYRGYVDEFRFFTKALTERDILHNYNHPLAGNENGLAIYYPFDEGMKRQEIGYDFSKTNGVSNGRHAETTVAAESSTVIPSEDQLSLMAYTDENGYYEVRGVPFSGEGTSYSIVPTLGIHEFSPSARSRFVSMSSLNHSGVDFEDVSSFPVKGKIIYSGTDYPVEGVNLFVDGIKCAKDGEPIMTDKNGEFTISVPIGEHFIQVEKSGHVFVNNGRFPADPKDTRLLYNFNDSISNMEFRDTTLVNLSGRVVGGSVEGDLPVGFALSKNNIGISQIVLTPQYTSPRMNVKKTIDGGVINYATNTQTVDIPSATDMINSKSWRGAGDENCRKLFIQTDPETGEFSALIPPLQYDIAPIIVVNSNPELQVGASTSIDMTNPNVVLADTLHNDDGSVKEYYEYNLLLKQTYHSEPSFTVRQEGHDDGAFGISSYTLTDEQGDKEVKIYEVDGAGKLSSYNFGSPIFIKEDHYTFLLKGFEYYKNADNGREDEVPLAGTVITITNAMSADQSVYVEDGIVDGQAVNAGEIAELGENQLQLDDQGEAIYRWQAGLPNIAEPYTRTISFDYDIAGRPGGWENNGMTGIVLGDLPTGNNFVTAGPDKLLMILRDPPGTNSFAEWTTGSSTTTSTVRGNTFTENFSLKLKHRFGFKATTITGTPGVGVINEAESKDDLTVGAKMESSGENSWTRTTTTTATRTISTSAAPEYVGAQGDVFVGTATNIIFGKARNLGFKRTANDDVELGLDDIVSTGLEFGTMFHYTQNYIENVLFPNFELMRRNLLKTVDQATIDNFTNNTDKVVYYTTLSEDDEDFGQKGTYTAFAPANPVESEHYEDSVIWVTNQINNWKSYLAQNEEAKVKAYTERDTYLLDGNVSFDSGTTVSASTETENSTTHTWDWTVSAGLVVENSFGFEINKFGIECTIEDETMGGRHETDENGQSTTTGFSYTLAEDGDDDALSVDILKYDAYGPIFRTRGGQTCCPYEGEVRTKYYEESGIYPVIMEGTMQIEVPQINVDVPTVSDVPTGGAANFTLRLSNVSEIDEDVYYRLLVADETNPHGANLAIDGKVITDNRVIKIPAGTTVSKLLQLKQSDQSVLDYDSIAVVLASQCQYDPTSTWDVITDTVYISAHFTPSSSPVTLALSNTTMNSQTGNNLRLTFSDFDRNYTGLKAFRLQYKKQGSTDWTQLNEYVLNKKDKTENNDTLPAKGANVTYILDMSSFSDGDYLFRVVSASTYGNEEVCRYSNEMALVKDMMRPSPLGQPEPSDGVLDVGDDLSITFNENILKGELTKENNFLVTGVLNGSKIAHETALSMSGGSSAGTAAAQTEADINLAKKDFSIDAWVNIGSEGTLLSHGQGTNKLTVGTNSDGKLVVTVAGNTYTSENAVPTVKWAFLTLNLTADGKLNASVADDANETPLFANEEATVYEGSGQLSIGGSDAAIHELLLWDEAHDMTTALLNRSATKSPSTRHLIGYWKMNEGEGTSIRDYARNRHMTMPNETWYLNNVNKAVSLDGGQFVSIDASTLATTTADDYAVELWMRGGQQTGEAQLLQMGDIALSLTADGELQLTGTKAYSPTEASTLATASGSLTDNAWHHVALNVLRQGAAAVYVDGKRCLTTNASNVGAINTNKLIVGARRISDVNVMGPSTVSYSYDRPFKGEVDEIRVWNATLNGDLLAQNRKVRFTGKEDGLVAYYPFETKTADMNTNQIITVGIDTCLVAHRLSGSTVHAEIFSMGGDKQSLAYTDNAPALRTKPTETNVNFSFTASDNKIVIDIDEAPSIIEGCTLNLTVRSVRDENGNYSLPAVWSAFVNRNELAWKESELAVTQQVKDQTSVTATIANMGGKQQMWTLEGMPSWLQASSEYGTTNPLAETDVTFIVSPATPIGKYEETIYLKGNDGIETPLTINVKVTGKVPEWTVNPKDFENSMNVIGRVEIEGTPMDDEDDIVAAFIGEECRGVAHPVYNQRYDGCFITMDIYGNNDDGKNVEFRAFDASTGTLFPVLTPNTAIKFTPLTLVGKYDEPVVFSVEDLIEQETDLKAGWNWLSLYVKSADMSAPAIFEKIADNVVTVKSHNAWVMNENGKWEGSLTGNLTNEQMYAVQLTADSKLRIVGQPVDPKTRITVKEGWNWIGYFGRQMAAVNDALSGIENKVGGILKGQSGVAYFDDYEWLGSLMAMEPGVGYMLNSPSNGEFCYTAAVTAAARNVNENVNVSENGHFAPISFRNYANNAIMAVKLTANGKAVGNAELGVFADQECRTATVTNENGLAYLTIPGDDETTLSFKVAVGGKIYNAATTVGYEVDGVYGSPANPLIIDLGEATGIVDVDIDVDANDVYDLQGRKVDLKDNRRKLPKGVYIVNGQKKTVK